jgi:hypothetical protein
MILGQELFPKPDLDKADADRLEAYLMFEQQMEIALMHWGAHSPFNENFVRLEAVDGSLLGVMTLIRRNEENDDVELNTNKEQELALIFPDPYTHSLKDSMVIYHQESDKVVRKLTFEAGKHGLNKLEDPNLSDEEAEQLIVDAFKNIELEVEMGENDYPVSANEVRAILSTLSSGQPPSIYSAKN